MIVRRAVLGALGVAALMVPSGAAPAGAGGRTVVESFERTDTFVVAETTCEVHSRQVHYSDGTVAMSTRARSPDATDAEVCFWGATEVRVTYSYVDADGDAQFGQATAPRLVSVTVPGGGGTELRSLHGVTYFDGSRTPDYRLPK